MEDYGEEEVEKDFRRECSEEIAGQKKLLKTLAQHFGIQHDACFRYISFAVERVGVLEQTVKNIKEYSKHDREIRFQAEEYSMFVNDLLASLEDIRKVMKSHEEEFHKMMEKKGIIEPGDNTFDNSNIRFNKHGGLTVLGPKMPKKIREKS